jgi:chemotaxis-related protein WspB
MASGEAPRMLYLLCRIGADRYAVAAPRIVEVLPVVQLKRLPGAVPGVAGLCNVHGRVVPVVDLSLLATGRPAPAQWGTRLLLVPGPGGADRLLGLLVEEATELRRLDDAAFADSGVRHDGAPWLGPVATVDGGMVQRVEPAALLPPAILDALFASAQAQQQEQVLVQEAAP